MSSRAILASGEESASIRALSCALLSRQGIQMADVASFTKPMESETSGVVNQEQLKDILENLKTYVSASPDNKKVLLELIGEAGKMISQDNLQQSAILNTALTANRAQLDQRTVLMTSLKGNVKDIATQAMLPAEVAEQVAIAVINEFTKIVSEELPNPTSMALLAGGRVAQLTKKKGGSRKTERVSQETTREMLNEYSEEAENLLTGLAETINEDMEQDEPKTGLLTSTKKKLAKPDPNQFMNAFINDLADALKEGPQDRMQLLVEEIKGTKKPERLLAQIALIRCFEKALSEKVLATIFTDFHQWLIPHVKENVMDRLYQKVISSSSFGKDSATAWYLAEFGGLQEKSKHNNLNTWSKLISNWELQSSKSPLYAQDLIVANAEELMQLLDITMDTTNKTLSVNADKFSNVVVAKLNEVSKMVEGTIGGDVRIPICKAVEKLYFHCVNQSAKLVLEGDFKKYMNEGLIKKIGEQKIDTSLWELSAGVEGDRAIYSLF